VLIELVDASDAHFAEHRRTVQTVLEELGAGDKPRLVAFNKADLLENAAHRPDAPAPAIAGSVFVSALTGFGMDTLRAEIAALLASLWEDVDVAVPYAAGELLARVRERGTIELEYGERDVKVRGRIAPSLAGELRAVGARWAESLHEGDGLNGAGGPDAAGGAARDAGGNDEAVADPAERTNGADRARARAGTTAEE
jgi:50S ribosomal subunit-associated GTPase HflX